jgi:hypothetical protein
MANRTPGRQAGHDSAVKAAAQIYRDRGRIAWTNPGGEKNKQWAGRYIDVIAAESQTADKAWVIEIETDDSVSGSEAKDQWKDYASVYSHWYLAVPVASKDATKKLLDSNRITNCEMVTWQPNQDGTHTFWGLPGLN